MIDELKLALEARLPHVYLSAEEASRQRIFLRKFLNIGQLFSLLSFLS